MDVLRDLFNDQNAFELAKIGGKILTDADIENQMVFKPMRELKEMAKRYENEDDEDAFREMNDYEVGLLKRFEEND